MLQITTRITVLKNEKFRVHIEMFFKYLIEHSKKKYI